MNVLYARNEFPGIKLTCPNCKTTVRHDSDDIGDAIKEGKPVVCVVCEKPFYVFVEVAPLEAVEHSVQPDDAKRPLTGRNGKPTNVLADGTVLETPRR